MTLTDRLNEIEARANAATAELTYTSVSLQLGKAVMGVPSLCDAVRRAVDALQNLTSYESHKCEVPEYSEGVDWGRAIAADLARDALADINDILK